MKPIVLKNSPNHYAGRRGWKPDIIVCHQSGCPQLAPALNYYLNGNECSPHWLIDVDGTIYQCVNPDDAAWCCGTRTTPGDKLYYGHSLSKIVRERQTNANYYSYNIEFVHCQWGNITEQQISAAVDLIKQVIIPHMKKSGVIPKIDREHIIGHSEVSPKTRDPEKYNCPGKKFPFDKIIQLVNGTRLPESASIKPGVKRCKILYYAKIRSKPYKNSAELGVYNPGQIVNVLIGSETKDAATGYEYIRVVSDTERWIVKSAIEFKG